MSENRSVTDISREMCAALSQMGYQTTRNKCWAKPIGYGIFLFYENEMTWQCALTLGPDPHVGLWTTVQYKASEGYSCLSWLRDTESNHGVIPRRRTDLEQATLCFRPRLEDVVDL